ncbi:N-acetylmuramoyl-L-alanine amidase [Neobacillus niacini]|uniref:cell wall hydrolase n=1 Tax=Neobacillus driksii TaxID=3035913 RepID=UPI0027813D02|nr:cell wall hydrolase [Neobacillus niacini]MDQ0976654.1 N-acetylmuramoyl-L-alanine amidase [Neobacillus niacini]
MFKNILALAFAGAFFFTAGHAFAYEVKTGDTMYNIAKTHNVSLEDLKTLNPQISDLNKIYVGQNVNTNKDNSQGSENVSNVSAYEKDLLARLVRAEAESEPYAGKVAVAYVVLNRVDHSQFPDTIKGVIYQSGQFTPVSNGEINQKADADSIRAVNEAVTADRSNSESLFFYNPTTATSRWLDSKQTTVTIGNHVFKK